MDKSPDAFRTISEVAEHLDTPAHVLRFWESRFTQIRPVKRAGGRRYYRPSDVALLAGIKRLLHEEGLTIRGVQKILREQGIRHVAGLGIGAVGEVFEEDAAPDAMVEQPAVDTARVIPIAPQPRPNAIRQPDLWSHPLGDAPEAPFIEAEEEALPSALPFPAAPHRPTAQHDDSPADPGAGDMTPLSVRLRRADIARMAPHAARLSVLRDRMANLRDRLADAARQQLR